MSSKLSVLVITYNHEKYIAACIRSILMQSFQDFELIIIDDGSTDNTQNIIRQFDDPRISYHYQENQGPSAASNTGVALARTEFISLMSGDDMAFEGRLQSQYNYFLEHPETTILFGRCEVIDENGFRLPEHPLQKLFDNVNYTTRYQLFHYFFFFGNCLNAVTCMFRRSVFKKTTGFQLASLQLQDYMLWLQWLKHSDFVLLDEKLAYYRVRKNKKNLSSERNRRRSLFEHVTILENILDDLDFAFFKQAFFDEIKNPDFSSKIDFELEKALLYLKHLETRVQAIGLKKLFYLLQDNIIRERCLQQYNMSMELYYSLTENMTLGGCSLGDIFRKIKEAFKRAFVYKERA